VTYRINDIYPCVQGEGTQAGVPMVMVRLQGCGVGCPWCDTRETWDADPARMIRTLSAVPALALAPALGQNARWAWATAGEIAGTARALGGAIGWALLSGGEPAEQAMRELYSALHAERFRVALETSGTAWDEAWPPFDWVTVSPKIDMPGGRLVLPGPMSVADEVKMVIGKTADIAALDALLDRCPIRPGAVVSLQPVSQSEKATRLCVETAMARNWRVSIQVHKVMGVR
jgi:7-carboxy-7-deazaguanine synthase